MEKNNMASFMIHLAAANEYLKNHDIDNKEDFILGVLAVDLAQDRIKSHYTKYTDKTDLLKFLSGKVSLEDYLHDNNVDTDYESVNNHVKSKYGVILPEKIKKYDISNGDDNCYLIDRNELDNFITSLGLISLDDYMNTKIESKNLI